MDGPEKISFDGLLITSLRIPDKPVREGFKPKTRRNVRDLVCKCSETGVQSDL